MQLDEAIEILKSNQCLIEKTSTEKYADEDEYADDLDIEYNKLERVLKKEYKRGHMSSQEYNFLYDRVDLLLDIIYGFMEKKG